MNCAQCAQVVLKRSEDAGVQIAAAQAIMSQHQFPAERQCPNPPELQCNDYDVEGVSPGQLATLSFIEAFHCSLFGRHPSVSFLKLICNCTAVSAALLQS